MAEFGGSEIGLWSWGFNVVEWLNDGFIFLYIKPLLWEKVMQRDLVGCSEEQQI